MTIPLAPISDSRNSAFLARGDPTPDPLLLRKGRGYVAHRFTTSALFACKNVVCQGDNHNILYAAGRTDMTL